jgi:hypothetical protein
MYSRESSGLSVPAGGELGGDGCFLLASSTDKLFRPPKLFVRDRVLLAGVTTDWISSLKPTDDSTTALETLNDGPNPLPCGNK